MVAIALPPPTVAPRPEVFQVPAGTTLLRLFDPSRFGATPLSFRQFGPLSRFDHHRAAFPTPALDTDRGIFYAARTLSGCLVEIFGDNKIIQVGSWELARLTVTKTLNLLDLRGGGAMSAGTVAAVCKDSNRQFSQAWSRFFYENIFVYDTVDGLISGNAHNDEDTFAFYERCETSFQVTATDVCPLNDKALRLYIQEIAGRTNMYVQPY